MNVAVVIPWRGGDPARERALAFAIRHWESMDLHPVVSGDSGSGPFNKAEAVNRGAERAGDWDTLIIADADMIVPPRQIGRCARHTVAEQRAAWPFTLLHRLTEPGTQRVLDGARPRGNDYGLTSDAMPGGVFVVPRALWGLVGGMDERFVGWGGEDSALVHACRVVAGQPERTVGESWHLWHPKAAKTPDYPANRELSRRYGHAQTPKDVFAIVNERNVA